jgi:uncharacterized membrane protein
LLSERSRYSVSPRDCMVKSLRESGRLGLTFFLIAVSLFCVGLSVFRVFLTGTDGYLFLNWNLFLAFLPWLLTSVVILRTVKSRIAILLVMGIWLLFFPNCLYMLTDLIHLRRIEEAPVWLDLIIVLSFAWAGLCYGFVSLMDIESFLKERFHAAPKTVTGLSVCMIYLAAFGIYIGRFLRWNSWDLFGNPTELIRGIFDRFAAGNDSRIIGFTLLMGTLLNFMYFPLRYVSRRMETGRQSA